MASEHSDTLELTAYKYFLSMIKVTYKYIILLYTWASLVAQRVKRLPAMWETWVRFLGQEDPLEKEMATHSSILAWRIPSHGWRSLVGYNKWDGKELDMTEQLHLFTG